MPNIHDDFDQFITELIQASAREEEVETEEPEVPVEPVKNLTERMIFGKTWDERRYEWGQLCAKLAKEKYNPRWFAWKPVRLDDGRWAWLTTVKRRRRIWVFGEPDSWVQPPKVQWVYSSTTRLAELAGLDIPDEEVPTFWMGVEKYEWEPKR